MSRIGQGAVLSKVDHSSAYKLIPCRLDHLFLQGFIWLDKTYIETSQIFGATSAVTNFDRFSGNVEKIVEILSEIDPFFLERQLDDQICITQSLQQNEQFVNLYLEIAEMIKLPLAAFEKDKAFLYQNVGTILGVIFDTNNMTWALSSVKCNKYMLHIQKMLFSMKVSKEDLQKCVGMLNTVTLICYPLKFMRDPIVRDLKHSYVENNIFLSNDSVRFLNAWLFIFEDIQNGLPIPKYIDVAPTKAVVLVSDAAGGAALKNNQSLVIGVGCVGFVNPRENYIEYAAHCVWPRPFISTLKDQLGKSFGNKTTLLEAIGVLLPLYHNFYELTGKHVVSRVDNVAVMWAWRNGRSRIDPYTSVIVHAIQVLVSFNTVYLYIEHLPRVSTQSAEQADFLSRQDAKGLEMMFDLSSLVKIRDDWPPSLLSWMNSPFVDWDLGKKILLDLGVYLFWVFGPFRVFVYVQF